MPKRTIIDRLRSLVLHRNRELLYIRDRDGYMHLRRADEYPDPTLPNQAYLDTEYLEQVSKSNPGLSGEATRLVAYARRERR